jgi:hypothetical protein
VASPEQLVHRSIEEHRSHPGTFQKLNVLRLSKSSAAERYDPRLTPEFANNLTQCLMLNPPEKRLARLCKYLFDAPSVALLDAHVQILERPTQALPQKLAHAALAGAHKADQEECLRFGSTLTHRSAGIHLDWIVEGGSPRQYAGFGAFLRWILPLKELSLTRDKALFMVPAKVLPTLVVKEV